MIEQFKTLISDSYLTKAAAVLFLSSLLLSCVGIAAYEIIMGIPVNSFVSIVLSAGIGAALSILGINQGVMLQPLPTKPTVGTEGVTPAVEGESTKPLLPIVPVKEGG
jgi:hypothetical protein